MSLWLSGGSAMRGAAMSATDSTASSAAVTSSMEAGRDSCRSLVSFSSAFFCCSCVSACLLAFCAACTALWANALTLLSSADKLVCKVLTLGDNLDSSVTELVAPTPPFLASLMSAVRDFCTSSNAVCCSDRDSWLSLIAVSSALASAVSFDLLMAAFTAASMTSTCSVAFWTRAAAAALPAPLLVVTAFEAWATLPLAAALVVEDEARPAVPPVNGSTKRMPGSGLGASHGIFHPTLGGVVPCELLRAHTCEPPISSPNHQPQKSGPSRASQ
mmetsp:Transcript_74465/g.240796  ORF Transcript_74465/g.240796 Transcript_74465/m.240796 type:complete len:273 (-) Transcript_74465:160-978(-)